MFVVVVVVVLKMGCFRALVALTLVVGVLCKAAPASMAGSSESCQPEKMTVYKMVLHTFWTRDKFPKHYPDWRPPAQWSKVYGMFVVFVGSALYNMCRALSSQSIHFRVKLAIT